MCMDRQELGERMLNWHSSSADPIYAVGSYYISDKVHPTAEVVQQALDVFTHMLDQTKRMVLGENVMVERQGKQVNLKVFAGYTEADLKENLSDLGEIVTYLSQYWEEDYK